MTYELGRYLNVPWESVSPNYDVKPSEYYYVRSLKPISDIELLWEIQRLGLKDIPDYERAAAEALWNSVKEVGDEPYYVSVSVTPPTSEQPYWIIETRVQALHKGSTPIIALIPMIKELLVALGFLLLAITVATLVFTAIYRGPIEIFPKEFTYALIALGTATTAVVIYSILKR